MKEHEEAKLKEVGEDVTSGFDVSRRTFFKGSALAIGGLAAAGLCNVSAFAQQADRTSCTPAAWEVAPAPIKDVKQTVNTDVVIIGCGISGLVTALSAYDNGVRNIIIIDKNRTPASRGIHNTAADSKLQKSFGIKVNYRQVIRELVRWAQGRVNEDLLSMFFAKSGACMDWLIDVVSKKDVTVGLWDEYYKGPDYTEYPVTHIFTNTKTKVRGNPVVVDALFSTAKDRNIDIRFQTKAVQFVKNASGKVTGVIAGASGNYTQFNASKGVVIATGDYASNKDLTGRYAPLVHMADAQIYLPNKCNTGDAHIMAMNIGGVMQKTEPHAAVIHLEAGAMSYGFLHVNALGKRFKNEDVNTQSKSCSKLFEPNGGIAWTIYDSDGLAQVQEQIEKGLAGGLFYGQMDKLIGEKWNMQEEVELQKANMEQGKVVTANTFEELAAKMGIPVGEFVKTVKRYNDLAKKGNDEDYFKRAELLRPIQKPPYYAGNLKATVLTMSGGLHTDASLKVLDKDDKPIEGLYVVGAAAGDFFAADYPTICPGIGHGRCITFGRLLGVILGGKSLDTVSSIKL
jgi:succinate dehydrogenase/fumarate reductase flavoprotein subunit